jgi:hypothetical protein
MQLDEEDIEKSIPNYEKRLMKIHFYLFIFQLSLFGNQINIFQFEAVMRKEDLCNLKLLYLNHSYEE